MDLAAKEPVGAVSLSDTTVDLTASGQDNKASFLVKGKTGFGKGKKAGTILVDGTASRFHDHGKLDLAGAEIAATVDVKELPVAFAEIAADSGGLLPALLGQTLGAEGNIKMTGNADPRGNIVLKASSERMALSADMSVGKTLSFNVPAALSLDLTPEAFSRLQAPKDEKKPKPAYGLQKTANLSARIINFSLPLPEKGKDEKINLGKMALNGELSVRDFFLTDKQNTAGFALLEGTVASSGLTSGLDFTLKGATGEAGRGGKETAGNLKVEGRLTKLIDAKGSLAPSAMSASLATDIKNLPVVLLDIVSGTQNKLTAILGPTMQVTSKADLDLAGKSGKLSLSEQSQHSSADLDALTDNGRLILAKDMSADLEITPVFSKIVLAKVNPLLGKAVSADKPISLRVKKENFQIPVDPYDVKKVLVDQARAEFGTVTLQNSGLMQALLGLLRVSSGNTITAQITPVVAHVKNGIATYERADFILDNRNRIASWGRIDLANDRVDMVLGLPAETLDKIFNIEGLDPDYVMQIPVQGTTADPRVDWGKAGREIAGLVAGQKLGGGKSPVGKLIQGILGGSTAPAPAAPPAPDTQQQGGKTQQSTQPAQTQPTEKQPSPPPVEQQDPMQQLLHQLIR